MAITISVCSLFVSGITLWRSNLAPADIAVRLSAPEFQLVDVINHSMPDNPVIKPRLAFIADCSFANNGASTGQVSLLAIQFVSDDGTKWTFLPHRVLDGDPRMLGGKVAYNLAIAPAYSSVILPGKQETHHKIQFSLDNPDDAVLAPHHFHIILWSWSGTERQPQRQQDLSLYVFPAMIPAVEEGSVLALFFDEQREQIKSLK